MSRTFPGRPARCDTLPRVNLAVIAAFTAAAVSVLNIILTAWLTRGSQFLRWQREEARPITARLLAHSGEARLAWLRATLVRQEWTRLGDDDRDRLVPLERERVEYVAAARAASAKLLLEAADLDLIATPPTRAAATELAEAHSWAQTFLVNLLSAGRPSEKEFTRAFEQVDDLHAREQALIDKFRADLALPRDRNWLRRIGSATPRLPQRPPRP